MRERGALAMTTDIGNGVTGHSSALVDGRRQRAMWCRNRPIFSHFDPLPRQTSALDAYFNLKRMIPRRLQPPRLFVVSITYHLFFVTVNMIVSRDRPNTASQSAEVVGMAVVGGPVAAGAREAVGSHVFMSASRDSLILALSVVSRRFGAVGRIRRHATAVAVRGSRGKERQSQRMGLVNERLGKAAWVRQKGSFVTQFGQ